MSGTGMSAASGLPITAVDSGRSSMRSEIRRFVLARMFSLTEPDGRWVARIRWMPRLRPRWAMSTTPATNSGTSFTKVANSSTTITSDAGASAGATSSISARSFARPSITRIRRLSSARNDVSARSDSSASRFVT